MSFGSAFTTIHLVRLQKQGLPMTKIDARGTYVWQVLAWATIKRKVGCFGTFLHFQDIASDEHAGPKAMLLK